MLKETIKKYYQLKLDQLVYNEKKLIRFDFIPNKKDSLIYSQLQLKVEWTKLQILFLQSLPYVYKIIKT